MAKVPWTSGNATGSYQIKGPATEFWQSAEGSLHFDIRDVSLPGMVLVEDAERLNFESVAGLARLHVGKIEISETQLDSSAGKFEVTGTASLARDLDLKLSRRDAGASGSGYSIAGTLDDPRVTPLAAPQTEAQLKAERAKDSSVK
jgi:hypothetical protein